MTFGYRNEEEVLEWLSEESEDSPEFGEEPVWVPHVDEDGAEGWKNTETGEVVYADEPPGEPVENYEDFVKSWIPYEGPQGGEGWRNVDTGEVIYQVEPPGERLDEESEPTEIVTALSDPSAGRGSDQVVRDATQLYSEWSLGNISDEEFEELSEELLDEYGIREPDTSSEVTEQVYDLLEEYEKDPAQINTGECRDFASYIESQIEDAEMVDSTDMGELEGHVSHYWVEHDGKFYDPEVPEGVEDWRELPFFRRNYGDSTLEQYELEDGEIVPTDDVEKERIYVDDPSQVPEWAEVQEGERGGYYYETEPHKALGEAGNYTPGEPQPFNDPDNIVAEADGEDIGLSNAGANADNIAVVEMGSGSRCVKKGSVSPQFGQNEIFGAAIMEALGIKSHKPYYDRDDETMLAPVIEGTEVLREKEPEDVDLEQYKEVGAACVLMGVFDPKPTNMLADEDGNVYMIDMEFTGDSSIQNDQMWSMLEWEANGPFEPPIFEREEILDKASELAEKIDPDDIRKLANELDLNHYRAQESVDQIVENIKELRNR